MTDGQETVRIEVIPLDTLPGTEREYTATVNSSWSVVIKLFPGQNKIIARTATGLVEMILNVKIEKPSLQFTCTWTENAKMTLHVYTDALLSGVTASGGSLHTGPLLYSVTGSGGSLEITCPDVPAGFYRIYVTYDEDLGSTPGPTKPSVTVKGLIKPPGGDYTQKMTIPWTFENGTPGTLGGSGIGAFSAGTMYVHAGWKAGAYQVTDHLRDLVPQGYVQGGYSPEISPKTTYQVTSLSLASPVYLCVGKSVKFTATGSVNCEENKQENAELIEHFTVANDPGETDVVKIDGRGVLTGLKPGHVKVNYELYATPVDVYVL